MCNSKSKCLSILLLFYFLVASQGMRCLLLVGLILIDFPNFALGRWPLCQNVARNTFLFPSKKVPKQKKRSIPRNG